MSARVAAAMAREIARGQASSAISTASARSVVPAGLVTLRRSTAAVLGGGGEQGAGAGHRLPGHRAREVGGNALLDRGVLQQFGEQEHIGRAAAGDGGDRVEQALVVDPGDDADGGEQRVAEGALLGGDAGGGAGDGHALADGGRRVRHRADDGGALAEQRAEAGDRLARP